MSRFASITADILARKGEARPWNGVGGFNEMKQPLAWAPPPPAPVEVERAMPEQPGTKMRKCTLRISEHDYQRLGILAVKQGKTRQRLLQETVERLFTGMEQDFGAGCRCLGAQSAMMR